MNRIMTRILCAASLGLGLGFATPAQAQHWPKHQQGPRYYQPCPPVVVPYSPKESRPSDLPPAEPGTTPSPDPSAPAAPTTPTAPTAPDLASAGAEGGGSTGMLGRGDQNQRFNLFDNMSAIPQNRVWFGFQYMNDYTTGLALSPSFLSFFGSIPSSGSTQDFQEFASDRKIYLYRAGVELATSCDCSIAVQWEYFTVNGDLAEDSFNNPQIMGKYVLSRNNGCVVSATLGFQPETDIKPFELNENHSRIYPGLLFYSEDGDCIVQGGVQVGIPFKEDQIKTFDWAISFGYWLYRNDGCNGYGHGHGYGTPFYGNHTCGNGCRNSCGHDGILGIIGQIELMGKHVIGDATATDVFGLPTVFDPSPSISGDEFSGAIFVYEEPRNVIDLTAGITVLISREFSVSTGVSVPLTDDEVRSFEYLVYFNYNF